jgi:hypothetical protein
MSKFFRQFETIANPSKIPAIFFQKNYGCFSGGIFPANGQKLPKPLCGLSATNNYGR